MTHSLITTLQPRLAGYSSQQENTISAPCISFFRRVFAVVLAAECFVGITINVFISAVQIMKWKAVRSLDSCDQILLCLGISRSLSLIFVSFEFVMQAFFSWTIEELIYHSAFLVPRLLLYYTCFWLTPILYVFYCVKIANYKNRVFLYMKTRISRLIPRLIGASLLISLAFTLPQMYFNFHLYEQNPGDHFVGNVSMNYSSQHNHQIQSILPILGFCLPFSIFCGAVSLLILSLWLHTRQMRSSGTSCQNSKLEAHFSVVKSMTLFLCCQIIYVGFWIFLLNITVDFASPWRVLFAIVVSAPSCLHSSYMVYSNTKLKQAFIEICRGFLRCI